MSTEVRIYGKLDAEKNVVPATAREVEQLLGDIDARRVGLFTLGPVMVSTVFLAINHGSGRATEPELWFETLIQTPGGSCCYRYETWAEAVAGHMKHSEDIVLATNPDNTPKWTSTNG